MRNILCPQSCGTHAPRATLLIRIIVGGVFFTEGIQKFLFTDLGVGRFTRLGFAHPAIWSNFVGGVEIIFGALILLGLFTRLSTIPLIIDISTAIWLTKVPLFIKNGFWSALHESRVDFSMLLGLIFLLIVGAGVGSIDDRMAQRNKGS